MPHGNFLQYNDSRRVCPTRDKLLPHLRSIITRYKRGASVHTLAREFTCSDHAMRTFLKRNGVSLRTRTESIRMALATGTTFTTKTPKCCHICKRPFVAAGSSQRYCKTCIPNKQASARYKNYGMAQIDWDVRYAAQLGKCAVPACLNKPDVVDHCHTSRRVRGLVCWTCNHALATLDLSLEWLKGAVDYVARGHEILICVRDAGL